MYLQRKAYPSRIRRIGVIRGQLTPQEVRLTPLALCLCPSRPCGELSRLLQVAAQHLLQSLHFCSSWRRKILKRNRIQDHESLGRRIDPYDLAAMLEGRAKRVAARWNTVMGADWEKAIVHYDKILDSVLTDVFNGKARFPRDVVANLRTRLGEDLYRKYRRLPGGEEKPTVPYEEIPDELLRAPKTEE